MNLDNIGTTYDSFPSLLFVPVGRKHPGVRSIGHKEEKALLSRLQTAVLEQFSRLNETEIKQFLQFLGIDRLLFPVPVYQQEEIYARLIKPDMFLWKNHGKKPSLPLQSEFFFEKEYGSLSAEQLSLHVKEIMEGYLFAAMLSERSRHEWLDKIRLAYAHHSFIQLAAKNSAVITGVEVLNKSPLLGVLRSPEDVAFWRHRVEIVMRPYRQIPSDWHWSMCEHPKELAMDGTNILTCSCPICGYGMRYDVARDCAVLPDEVDITQATKRIATIERQWNEMAENSVTLMSRLTLLQELKRGLAKHEGTIHDILSLQKLLGPLAITHPILEAYTALEQMVFPAGKVQPTLHSLVHIVMPDIAVLKKVEQWQEAFHEQLDYELEEFKVMLQKKLEENKPKPDDVLFESKQYMFTREQRDLLVDFFQKEEGNLSLLLVVQVLTGEPTSKVRALGLHEQEVFAMLADWPAKVVTKLLLSLEENGYIKKENKRYIG